MDIFDTTIDICDLESQIDSINAVPLTIRHIKTAAYMVRLAIYEECELTDDRIEEGLDSLWQEGARFNYLLASTLLKDATFKQWLLDTGALYS